MRRNEGEIGAGRKHPERKDQRSERAASKVFAEIDSAFQSGRAVELPGLPVQPKIPKEYGKSFRNKKFNSNNSKPKKLDNNDDASFLFRVELPGKIEGFSPKGRKQRKPDERPRPDLPASAPANRAKKQISLSLRQELIDAVNGAARQRGVDRNALIEHAIRAYLQLK